MMPGFGEDENGEPTGEENGMEGKDLTSKFLFFANYEEREKEKIEKKRKPFQLQHYEKAKVVEAIVKAKPMVPKSCMAINCAVCRLRVIYCLGLMIVS